MKKFSALILSSALLLSACGNTNVVNNATTPGTDTTVGMPMAVSPMNCLQGVWTSDKNALTAYMKSTIVEMSPTVTNGSIDMTFNGNSFIQSVPSLTVSSDIQGMNMTMTMSGAVRGTFSEVVPGTIQFESDGTSTTKLDSMTLNGQPFTSAPIEMGDLFVGQKTKASYQCNGNMLTLVFPVVDTRTTTMVLTRK